MKINNHRNIHPFPARMAPEIAIQEIRDLQVGDLILDPMVGSGTVLHHAARMGFKTIGFDLDPLAVLMTKVRTSKININKLQSFFEFVTRELKSIKLSDVALVWMDNDQETKDFVEFWFARKQINSLRKISFLLFNLKKEDSCIEVDVLRIALSRIIITKKIGASLAWDISHSRPHKVREENDYNVFDGFVKSVEHIKRLLSEQQVLPTKNKIVLGDARKLKVPDQSIDRIITSPPYLNAIDYMRGHKFSLIWLGYSIPQLRKIRSESIGVEKILGAQSNKMVEQIYSSVLPGADLKTKQVGMIKRYINDSADLMSEVSRVLKPGKKATLVIGNSNLNNQNIENSEIFKQAGKYFGLNTIMEHIREIPQSRRYLPVPINSSNSLSKRMKHEVIVTLIKE